jgi:hypothetical protein
MKWLDKFTKKSKPSASLFPGKRLNIDEILELKNSTSMIIELSYGISDKIHRTGFGSLSLPERVLHHVYWLESEINNGGFEQYFINSSGDYALDTPSALDEIGAYETAKIVKQAIDIFPGGEPPLVREDRIKKIDSMDESTRDKYSELDLEFLKYPEPLEELQVQYMIAKKNQIQV